MFIDDHGILCLEEVESIKNYRHNLSGYDVESEDKIVFVWHKKEIKTMPWKDLGQNMAVFWVNDRMEADVPLDRNSIAAGVAMFDAFDEDLGQKYYFLPKFSEEKMIILQKKLSDVGVDLPLVFTDKGVVFSFEELEETQTVAFLFGLSLVWGRREIREGDLKSVKIQLSLFGQYLQKRDDLDLRLGHLQKSGVFVKHDVQETNDGVVYQIVVSDYELLHLWINLYQNIENVEKISKYEQMLEAKIKLLEYIKHNDLANEQQLKDLDAGLVKVLTKG